MEEKIKQIEELRNEYDKKINESTNVYERLELTAYRLGVEKCYQILIEKK